MSIKLTRRIAAKIMERGESSVRINPTSIEEAKKAITREDVRAMIKSGAVYAIPKKKNLSRHGELLATKRAQGRSRGKGRRKGSKFARTGLLYPKKVRSQRRILKELKSSKTIDNNTFKKYYRLVRGNSFQTKISLINHIKESGIAINDEMVNKLKHI